MRPAWLVVVSTAALAVACAAPERVEVKPVPVYRAEPPAPPKAVPGPVLLKNPGFEEEVVKGARCAMRWHCTVHANPKSFRFFTDTQDGRRSYCMEPAAGVKAEPWALVTQSVPIAGLRGARLRFTIAMSSTGLTGSGAGPWIQTQRSTMPKVETRENVVRETTPWQPRSVELAVPADAITVEVGVIVHGGGRTCFDEARLEILQ